MEKPLRELLLSFQMDDLTAKHSSGIVVRALLILLTFLLIKKLKFERFTGLTTLRKYRNLQAIIFPLVFISMGLFSNWKTYINAELFTLLLFIFFVITVGFLEELIFRGTIFPLCIKAFKNARRPILVGAIVSSSLFGIVHFFNLFSQPENLKGIISQVFFALSIGIFFSGLLVRTQNIIIPALIHAFVNFSFGSGELKAVVEDMSKVNEGMGINWSSIIPTTLFFSFIMAGGIYMILKSNTEGVLKK